MSTFLILLSFLSITGVWLKPAEANSIKIDGGRRSKRQTTSCNLSQQDIQKCISCIQPSQAIANINSPNLKYPILNLRDHGYITNMETPLKTSNQNLPYFISNSNYNPYSRYGSRYVQADYKPVHSQHNLGKIKYFFYSPNQTMFNKLPYWPKNTNREQVGNASGPIKASTTTDEAAAYFPSTEQKYDWKQEIDLLKLEFDIMAHQQNESLIEILKSLNDLKLEIQMLKAKSNNGRKSNEVETTTTSILDKNSAAADRIIPATVRPTVEPLKNSLNMTLTFTTTDITIRNPITGTRNLTKLITTSLDFSKNSSEVFNDSSTNSPTLMPATGNKTRKHPA